MTRERDIPAVIAEQAAQAWETFHAAEQATAAEHREFADWVARSPEHVEAYLRVARAMSALKSPQVNWPQTPVEDLIREAKAAGGEVIPMSRVDPSPARGRAVAIQPRFALAAAATMVLSIAAALFIWVQPERYETRFGEQRSVLLDDGSRVTLNTASKIEVELRDDHRTVKLLAGEALFDVAHDASRPFDVYTGESILRAVGTRFDVDMRPGRTTVTVVEGIVSLTQGLPEALPHGNTPLLEASDRVVIGPAGPSAPEHGVRLDMVTSWTERKLVFEHRLLGEVAEEFNRYNRERIVIESEQLRSERITGVFRSNDSASFVSFLSGIPGVEVRGDGDGGYLVTQDPGMPRP